MGLGFLANAHHAFCSQVHAYPLAVTYLWISCSSQDGGEFCVGKRTVWFSCHHGKEPAASQARVPLARPSVPLCPKHNTVYSCQISTGTGANILYLCEDQLCGMSAPSTDSCTYLALDDLRFVNRPSSGHLGRLEILIWEIRQGF